MLQTDMINNFQIAVFAVADGVAPLADADVGLPRLRGRVLPAGRLAAAGGHRPPHHRAPLHQATPQGKGE